MRVSKKRNIGIVMRICELNDKRQHDNGEYVVFHIFVDKNDNFQKECTRIFNNAVKLIIKKFHIKS